MKCCPNCGKEVKPQNKFCNSSCAASHNNKLYRKRVKQIKKCINCEKVLEKAQVKYCCRECQVSNYKNSVIIPKIQKGEYRDSTTLKKYLFDIRGEKCEECAQVPFWNGKKLCLQLDHIDGNSDNCNLSNLRILCPNCHTQTETFTSRNRKNSERNKYFRQYYKNRTIV